MPVKKSQFSLCNHNQPRLPLTMTVGNYGNHMFPPLIYRIMVVNLSPRLSINSPWIIIAISKHTSTILQPPLNHHLITINHHLYPSFLALNKHTSSFRIIFLPSPNATLNELDVPIFSQRRLWEGSRRQFLWNNCCFVCCGKKKHYLTTSNHHLQPSFNHHSPL